MVRFGSGTSDAATAVDAARSAVAAARAMLGEAPPRVALVFFSPSYADVPELPAALHAALGDVPVVGATAGGCVFGSGGLAARGVAVVLLGGELEVTIRAAEATSSELLEVVPAAEEITARAIDAAGRGLIHHACLVFAPGIYVDGEALVAAVRKGAGTGMQLAGGLSGDDFTMDRPAILEGGAIRQDRVVLVGLAARSQIGVAARHGWTPIGPTRVVTRSDGPFLVEIDKRPALDVWLEDAARSALGAPPSRATDRRALVLALANHFPLGLLEENDGGRARGGRATTSRNARPKANGELVARTPYVIREDGVIQLSASIAEGARVRVMHGSKNDLLRASRDAATTACLRAGGRLSGALVLACSGRLAALGEAFVREPTQIGAHLGVPFAGACVFGEIARNVRDVDGFYNTTAVVVAFGSGD